MLIEVSGITHGCFFFFLVVTLRFGSGDSVLDLGWKKKKKKGYPAGHRLPRAPSGLSSSVPYVRTRSEFIYVFCFIANFI